MSNRAFRVNFEVTNPTCAECGADIQDSKDVTIVMRAKHLRMLCGTECLSAWAKGAHDHIRAGKSTSKNLLLGMGYQGGIIMRDITDSGVTKLAKQFNLDEPTLRAIMQVESSNAGFDGKGRSKILLEGHHVWRLLKEIGEDPSKLAAAHPESCYAVWKKTAVMPFYKLDQYDRYMAVLNYGATQKRDIVVPRAALINDTNKVTKMPAWEAYKRTSIASCSWGRCQIMGFNYRAAGFKTLYDFKIAMDESEEHQIQAGLTFMQNRTTPDGRTILKCFQEHDWEAAARSYNGTGAVEAYSARLEKAHASFIT